MNATLTRFQDVLSRISVGSTQSYRNIMVLQLHYRGGDPNPGSYEVATPQLLERGLLEVGRETGTVAQLQVTSHCPQPVFIPAGFRLLGGGQNRAVVASMILAAHAQSCIPVRCVQASRWEPQSHQPFTGAGDTASLAASSTCLGSTKVSQAETWQSVDRTIRATDTVTNTADLSAVYEHTQPQRQQYLDQLHQPPDPTAVGLLCLIRVGHSDTVQYALDLFGQHTIFATLYPALIESALVDAVAAQWRNEHDNIVISGGAHSHWHVLRALLTTALEPESIKGSSGTLFTGISAQQDQIAALFDGEHMLHIRLRR